VKKSFFWRNFFRGMSKLFVWDFNRKSYEERFGSDAELLASDWKKVGDDIRHAIRQENAKTK